MVGSFIIGHTQNQRLIIIDYCSTEELSKWTGNVNNYVEVLKNYLERDLKIKVSYLHTGSIPSQLGKPIMTMGELSKEIIRYGKHCNYF